MSATTFTRIPSGGYNRAVEPHALRPDELYDVLNLRPGVGSLRQTAPFVNKQALTLLTGESTATAIKLVDIVRTAGADLRYLVMNHTNARYIHPTTLTTQTLIPCILQTAVPNNDTATGYCLMTGFNTTDFSSASDSFTIEIDSSTTFKWRKNSGTWTTGVSVGTLVAVGANGLKVSFNATTGFTSGNGWVWTRSETIPYSGAVTSTAAFPYSKSVYLTDYYVGGVGRSILRVRDGLITSVGYKRVYGKYVTVFENHLVISHFAEGSYDAVNGVKDTYDATTTPFRVGWSDLNNPDQHYSTSINEADTKDLPYGAVADAVNQGITGQAPIGHVLYFYLPDAIHGMNYVGLPHVMYTEQKFDGVGSYFPSGLVPTKNGHYFIGKDNFWFFDGTRPTAIGEPVRTTFFSEIVAPTDSYYNSTFGYYDSARQEVIWTYWTLVGGKYQSKQIVYQEKYGWWYFRNMPGVDTGATNILTMGRVYQTPNKLLYGGSGVLYFDYDSTESTSAIVTDTTAAGYTAPYFISPDLFYEDLFRTKENDGLEIDAGWSSGVTGLTVSVAKRDLLSASPTFVAATPLWTPTITGIVGCRPSHGRIHRFKFEFTGTKPVGCLLCGWGERLYGSSER